jgi:hypothetical protein
VIDAISYLYGRNTHDRSYVTGVGIYAPMNPHHRPSGADGIVNPWPGYLVGGSPGNNQQDPVLTLTPTGLAPADYWADQQGSYSSNEVCLNWQGALVYALSGCIGNAGATPTPTPAAVPASCGTGITIDGNLNDAAWQTGDWAQFNRLVSGLDPNGTSAKFKVRWDSNYLYVAVAVSTSSPHNDSTNYYDDDSVEIYLDMFDDKSTTYNPGALNDFEFAMRYNDQTIYGANAAGVLGHTAATPDGFAVEMAFPWTTLNVVPTAGAVYGFDVGINVNPNGGTPRDGVLMWHGDSNNWENTSKFGSMQLGSACGSSPTYTVTITPAMTVTPTGTSTGTATSTDTLTFTSTATSTYTLTPTFSGTITATCTITVKTATPTFTPYLSPTITMTPAQIQAGNPGITDVKIWPNPYNPDTGNINFGYALGQDSEETELRIYTASFRLIKEIAVADSDLAGSKTRTVDASNFSGLASGTYYILIEAEQSGREVKSQPAIIIILR